MKKIWLVISSDGFVISDNLRIILKISEKSGIGEDSVTVFSGAKIDFNEIQDISQTVSFFGDRLIIIKDFDITDLNDEELDNLCNIIEGAQGTYFAVMSTCEDMKKLTGAKYNRIISLAQKDGIYHLIKDIDEKYLIDGIVACGKELGATVEKDVAKYIIQNVGKDMGLLVNETAKYAAACNYSVIDKGIVDSVGIKTVEASVFDIIDLICNKKPIKAVETLNKLFYLGADEIAILGALSTSFVDIHRCKLAQAKGLSYTTVHKDFEKSSNPYRYQKAMANSGKFSLEALNSILKLLLDTDIAMKSSSADKKQALGILTTQIIAKGMN
ncbi:MAG: hypothetical protein RR827_00850 [Oscillospiraceae bacterium]